MGDDREDRVFDDDLPGIEDAIIELEVDLQQTKKAFTNPENQLTRDKKDALIKNYQGTKNELERLKKNRTKILVRRWKHRVYVSSLSTKDKRDILEILREENEKEAEKKATQERDL